MSRTIPMPPAVHVARAVEPGFVGRGPSLTVHDPIALQDLVVVLAGEVRCRAAVAVTIPVIAVRTPSPSPQPRRPY